MPYFIFFFCLDLTDNSSPAALGCDKTRAGAARRVNLARIEMFAPSNREMGQLDLARNAASIKSHCAAFGTAAMTSRWIWVNVHPAAIFSMVTVAVVSI